MQQNIFYYSGNVANLRHTLVANVAPNYTYRIDSPFTLHHMRDNSNPSGLVYSNIVHYSGSLSFTAPPDNVSASFELVRVGTSATDNEVTLYYSNFDYENYDNYNYSFYAKAYENVERTTLYSSQKSNIVTKDSSGNFRLTISDLTTIGKYFQINTFKNETADCNVYKGIGTSSLLSFNVYDVRGLAYMRESNLDNYEQFNIITSSVPGAYISQSEVRLSADGNRMLVLNCYDSNGKIRRFIRNKNDWVQLGTDYGITFTLLYRFNTGSLESSAIHYYSDIALTEDGDMYFVCQQQNIKVYKFTDNTFITTIPFPTNVQCVTISSDNKRLLASANHAIDFTIGGLNGPKGGIAKVFLSDDGWLNYTEEGNLSSNNISDFNSDYYYGSCSALSGDGRTAVVWGTPNTGNSEAFIWKKDELANTWVHVASITPDMFDETRHRISCALSHDGKVMGVCSSRQSQPAGKAHIFETSNYVDWTNPLNESGHFNSCDVSGDGKTVLFAMNYGELPNEVLKIYRRNYVGIWNTKSYFNSSVFVGTRGAYRSCALSYDASTIGVSEIFYNSVYTLCFDKNVTINAVYDYFNLNSFFFNNFFDYSTIQSYDWGTTFNITAIHEIDDALQNKYGYGHWDGTSISADGRFVLVGEPTLNRVLLYDTVKQNVSHTFTETGSYFGLRCAMDDLANFFAIVGVDNLYIYKREENTITKKHTINHGYNNLVYHFKMSRNGNIILLSSGLDSTVIKKYETIDVWETVPTVQDLSNTKKNSAFDTTNDGNVIVAGQRINDKSADLTVFFRGAANTTYSNTSVTLTTGTEIYFHSFAITGKPNDHGIYTILAGGAVNQNIDNKATFRILTFNGASIGGDIGLDEYTQITTTNHGRFGRTCALSYDGSVGILSGSMEADSEMKGSAVLIDIKNRRKIREFTHNGASPSDTPIETQYPSIEFRFNKYGSGCLISSDNKNVLVSGGGYAFMYKIDTGIKNLYFPFETNGQSSDASVTFDGSSYSSNGASISAGNFIKLDFGTNIFLESTRGFEISFFVKPATTNNSNNLLKVRVGEGFLNWLSGGIDSFYIRLMYSHPYWSLITYITDTNGNQYAQPQRNHFENISLSKYYHCRVRFVYDSSIYMKFEYSELTNTVSILGPTGYKSTTTQEITIGSEYGAFVKDFRVIAF